MNQHGCSKLLNISKEVKIYGKCFESMYEGSMVGAGINVFAVWNYIIAKNRRGAIEVNPKLLAFTLGGEESEIESALKFLCRPDPDSRSKLEEGRRLVKEGQYQYRLVNWEFYEKIKSEEDRREYNRRKQAEYRAKKRAKPPDANEREAEKCHGEGDEDGFDAAVTRSLPKQLQ